ncbi:hypothetical protein ACIG0C_31230 [Kitasatospora aureofaciens]|uniref:Uncharacterized protein n=1 Tax=Kitasatospora aureofaciens TaxID=1894 RepID=A0A1E7N049_KITAU|nr:hypothetical protein [Kitasatospora aureofaciens]QEU99127.1 hypothetical protein CP971_07300 [Streptomyces viridifaciens]ARF77926.1 hypothetical protein B6264_02405 [Kitasatospora aureofaciens]OEV34068.1 hypothetical protein HS99_0011555 [Kitasatospora aureofaciens]UKZ05169.1 hypothetical protein BOQ63_014150 [Streptomyces viridifaciens]GGU72690.1 hypothetical protein GCM10010502_25360 [Kitasatospora aureofaciens]
MTLPLPSCRAHGPGLDCAALVGRRSVRLASGTDRCLMVDAEPPYEGYDMGDWGRIEVLPADTGSAFDAHLGEPVLAIRDECEQMTGRMALELDFPSGTVRCESYGGELIVRAVLTDAP